MSSATYAQICSGCGLLLVSYNTAKALKRRLDAEFDEEIERQNDEALERARRASTRDDSDPTPSSPENASGNQFDDDDRPASVSAMLWKSPGRKSLLGRARRMSTMERTSLLQNNAHSVETLLKFWVLLGLVQLCSTIGIWYSVEIRTMLVVFGALPAAYSREWLERAFRMTATPLMTRVIPALKSSLRNHAYAVLDVLSTPYRRLLSLVILYSSQHASTEELLSTERALGREQALLAQARKTRRLQMLQAETAPGGLRGMGHDGDYLDDDETMFAAYRSGGAAASGSAGGLPSGGTAGGAAGHGVGGTPGRVSDLWGMPTPKPKSQAGHVRSKTAAVGVAGKGGSSTSSGEKGSLLMARPVGAGTGAGAGGSGSKAPGSGGSPGGEVRRRPASVSRSAFGGKAGGLL